MEELSIKKLEILALETAYKIMYKSSIESRDDLSIPHLKEFYQKESDRYEAKLSAIKEVINILNK